MTTDEAPPEQWQELEALAAELRAQDEQWRATCEAMAAQLELVRGVRESIEQYLTELGINDALLQLGHSLLNDAGRLHTARLNYGLTHSAALIWHPLDDPRPGLREAPPEAQYAIEVRIGPRYLLGVPVSGAADERLSLLIAGEKRLVATLPTSRERFRAALLRAFGAPSYSGPPRDASGEPDAAGSAGETSGEEASGTPPSAAEAERVQPRAKTSDAAPRTGETAEASTGEPGAAGVAEEADQPPARRRSRRRKAAE